MINIGKYIKSDLIITDLGAKNKEEAIHNLVERIYKISPLCAGYSEEKDTFNEVMAREKMQTTGIGEGMAFPHARISGWGEFIVAIGINKTGIEFNSLDNVAVNFICLMISSPDQPYIILQTMAAIIRFMRDTRNMDNLFEDFTAERIIIEFLKYNIQASKVILARDIMRPVKIVVDLDTTIENAARTMHLKHLDVLPVVDKENRFRGAISCFDIFSYGIPDFFNQLNTVSFVRHIDPFEKYFKIKRNLAVKDILKEDSMDLSQEATLVEIIFEITVKNKPKLFVVDNGKLAGEIDRFNIIDKILFF